MTSSTFVFLSKLLPAFIYPVGFTIALLLVTLLLGALRHYRAATTTLLAALLWLWMCSTPIVAEHLARGLEQQFPPLPLARTPRAEVAIVLGGSVAAPMPPRIEVELVEASSRVLHAARLYRSGIVARIIVVGGNLPWQPRPAPEAQIMRQLLIEWGVPFEAISLAGASRNTIENALEVAKLREKAWFRSALLITSATHMPRAVAVFRRAGIPVTASTVHVTVVDRPTTVFDWLPDAAALAMTTNVIKEWIGIRVYRWWGYVD
jgi:uncharacterized SAM-binding protein YcdF (DUF218 family)